MSRPRLRSAALVVALLATLVALAGCENPRENDAAREGLPEEVGGLEYNVYISRLLNVSDVEDRGYYQGPGAPPGSALFGVFLQACNEHDEARLAARDFAIEDTQGNTFRPVPVEEDNIWVYEPRSLGKGECIPRAGTLAESGPTGGSLLVFELPLEALENRPLNLVITAPPAAPGREPPERGRVELDV